jgi:hypothetical protein
MLLNKSGPRPDNTLETLKSLFKALSAFKQALQALLVSRSAADEQAVRPQDL